MNKPWHEDDSFWETWSPMMFNPERLKLTPMEADGVIELVKPGPEAAVLDLGCGPGRITLELARRGFRMTGVDRTARYLATARKGAEEEGLDVELVQGDMREFVRREAFDAVISLFTTFGYFEDPADDRRVVENVYKSLKPGGVFLIDMHGKETLSRIFQERTFNRPSPDVIMLEERRVTRNWSWMESRWILIKDGERHETLVSHRLYAATEIAAMLEAAGFAGVDVYGNLQGGPYDQTARRLVVVGRK